MQFTFRLRFARSIALASVATGILVLARVASESWIHGYLSLGFYFTILKALAWDSSRSVPVAVGIVALCEVVIWKTREGWGHRLGKFSDLRLTLLLALFLVIALWLSRGTPAENLGLLGHDIVYLAAVFGVLVFLLQSGLSTGRPGLRRGFAFVAMLGTVLLGAMPVYWPQGRGIMSDILPSILSLVIGGGLVAILLLGISSLEMSARGSRALYCIAAAFLVAGPLIAHLARPTLKPDRAHNIVFIAIDTLRLDHTSIGRNLGRRGPTTPYMEGLAKSGVWFENAISQAPWTLPAFASVLTGLYPPEHGAILHSGLLRRSEVTLAEILREAGYSTGATISHAYVDADHGFGQGFDEFREDLSGSFDSITSRGITDQAIDFVDRQGSQPFFLFAHYADPHYEYRDHQEFDYADGYRGWIDERPGIHALRHNSADLTPADVEQIRDLYDEEVSFTDREVGRLLEHLEQRALTDSTAIILVADHGEEFLERGWLGHTVTLYEEVVRVPLLLAFPAWQTRGVVVRQTVETRALLATVLDYLGIDWSLPSASFPAQSLRESLAGNPERREAGAYTSVWLESSGMQGERNCKLSSYRNDSWKLILDHDRGELHLFDLSNDADERVDLADSESAAEMLSAMTSKLEAWLEAMPEVGPSTPKSELSPEEIENLRALGYL